MKLTCIQSQLQPNQSLPSRECGLKCSALAHFVSSCSVTPLAGVWVEIPTAYEPYTGGRPSFPSRECGLKSVILCHIQQHLEPSLPSRECGLKYPAHHYHPLIPGSLPSRECGLKFVMHCLDERKRTSHSPRGSVG